MENDEMNNNQLDSENIITGVENPVTETEPAPEVEALPPDVKESTGNLDICPNCLEPNTDDLAVCKYCGMPLHQGADAEEYVRQESEAELEANRAQAAPETKKPAKKQENGFRRVMPWLGLYLIYYAITGCFDVNRQIKAAEAEGQAVNAPLAYGAQVIWFAAGIMMAWPLIKKGYRKLRGIPEPEEVEESAEETTGENPAEEAVSEDSVPEKTDELPAVNESTAAAAEADSVSESDDGSTEA